MITIYTKGKIIENMDTPNVNQGIQLPETYRKNGWHSVKDRPLFIKDETSNWICTEDGDGDFIAALPYNDIKRPNENLWWIRHCVVDGTGLCVVGDDYNEPAGWNLENVTHWMRMPASPDCWNTPGQQKAE